MTFETATSVTHKLWDRSTMHHELDSLIHDLSVRHNTAKSNIAVHASGPEHVHAQPEPRRSQPRVRHL